MNWTILNFQLLTTDHSYTCNYITKDPKLTFTASNPTELHDTAKMEKPKHNSIGDIWSLIIMWLLIKVTQSDKKLI